MKFEEKDALNTLEAIMILYLVFKACKTSPDDAA